MPTYCDRSQRWHDMDIGGYCKAPQSVSVPSSPGTDEYFYAPPSRVRVDPQIECKADSEMEKLKAQLRETEVQAKAWAEYASKLRETQAEKNKSRKKSNDIKNANLAEKVMLQKELGKVKQEHDIMEKYSVELKAQLRETQEQKNNVKAECESELRAAQEENNTFRSKYEEVQLLRARDVMENTKLRENVEKVKLEYHENKAYADKLQQWGEEMRQEWQETQEKMETLQNIKCSLETNLENAIMDYSMKSCFHQQQLQELEAQIVAMRVEGRTRAAREQVEKQQQAERAAVDAASLAEQKKNALEAEMNARKKIESLELMIIKLEAQNRTLLNKNVEAQYREEDQQQLFQTVVNVAEDDHDKQGTESTATAEPNSRPSSPSSAHSLQSCTGKSASLEQSSQEMYEENPIRKYIANLFDRSRSCS